MFLFYYLDRIMLDASNFRSLYGWLLRPPAILPVSYKANPLNFALGIDTSILDVKRHTGKVTVSRQKCLEENQINCGQNATEISWLLDEANKTIISIKLSYPF